MDGESLSAGEPVAGAADADVRLDVRAEGHRNRPVSWVRRGVRMTEGQEVAWQEHGHKYLIEPPRGVARESIAPDWVLDLAAEFQRPMPPSGATESGSSAQNEIPGGTSDLTSSSSPRVIVEIGTGRGENVVAAAERHPDTNFLGVEVYGPGLARAILLAEAAKPGGFQNLRLIQADAPEVLSALPEASVDEIWVFFPDPWPKNRHLKRRMIDADFAALAAKVLKPGGLIRLATDWEHYAEQMQEVFAASSAFQQIGEPHERFEGRVLTAFEQKGITAGRNITDLTYLRK